MVGFNGEVDVNIVVIMIFDDQVRVYQVVGECLDILGLIEEGDEKCVFLVVLFNQYLVEKGILNLFSSDVNYFIGFINDYEEFGNVDVVNVMLIIVCIYVDVINDDEYLIVYVCLLFVS